MLYKCVIISVLTTFYTLYAEDINSAGRNGKNGQNGVDGINRVSFGQRAGDGQDGKDGADGENGKSVNIQIERKNKDEVFSGEIVISGEIANQKVNSDIVVKYKDLINIDTSGGEGGKGGNGGKGENGQNGRDGSNSYSKYRNGENGENGEDGGNGGDGAKGGNGGNSANATISVPYDQSDLLQLIGTVKNKGGEGGQPGKNGQGGDGGRGGNGGKGYSWTEEDCTGYGEDRDCITTYESTYNGRDGSNGRDGVDGSGYLAKGQNGQDGEFKIRLVKENGEVITGDSIPSLELTGFDIVEDKKSQNGVIEPGETVHIENISVINTGSLPTPKYQHIEIKLNNGDWVKVDNQKLTITEEIYPNQQKTLDGSLSFQVPNKYNVEEGKRFIAHTSLSPDALQKGVDKYYRSFRRNKSFSVSFPIEITPLKSTLSVLPGQKANITWKVKNISGQNFGSSSDFKRALATSLKIDPNGIDSRSFKLKDSKGNEVDLDEGFINQITILKPNEELLIEGSIEVNKDALAYSHINLKADVKIDQVNGDKYVPIQNEKLSISVSKSYKKTADSDLLLVINNETKKEEIDAWHALFQKLGLKSDEWDTSYEGYFSMYEELVEEQQTVGKDFAEKTLVVLNNDKELNFDPKKVSTESSWDMQRAAKDHEKIQADRLIHRRDLLQAVKERNINFYFVGKDKKHNEEQMKLFLTPTFKENVTTLDTKNDFFEKLKQGEILTHTNELAQFDFTKSRYLNPKEEDFKKEAQAIADKLAKDYPEKRFQVIYDYAPLKLHNNWVRTDPYQYGRIIIKQSLDSTQGSVSALAKSNADLKNPEFILGSKNMRSLISSLNIDQKLKIYKKYLNGELDEEIGEMIEDQIILDVAQEQKEQRKEYFNSNLIDKLFDNIDGAKVYSGSDTLETSDDKLSSYGEKVLRLTSKLQHQSDLQERWFHQVPFVRSFWWNDVNTNYYTEKIITKRSRLIFSKNSKERKSATMEKMAKQKFKTYYAIQVEKMKDAGEKYYENGMHTLGTEFIKDTELGERPVLSLSEYDDYVDGGGRLDFIEQNIEYFKKERDEEKELISTQSANN